MKTIKKAILILASVISLSVICGCKQEPNIIEYNKGTVEALSKEDYSIESSSEGKNKYFIHYRGINYDERFIVYYNTTDDLKSATKLEQSSGDYFIDLYLYTEEHCYDIYYFWAYHCTNYFGEPREESGVTPVMVTYKFENKLPYPKNLKVEYSSEILNEIVVTWDPINDDDTPYYLYSNTVNDISSAKKVTYNKRDYFYYDSETSGGLIYKQILLEDKSLYFWIKAAVGNGNGKCYSDFSEPVSLDFKHKKSDAPTGFSVTGTGSGTATLKLNEKATRKPKFYKIYCAEENDFSKVIYKKTLYSTKEVAKSDGDLFSIDYFSYTNKIGNYYWHDLFYEGESFYFWIKAADTPDEDANPETESELVGPDDLHL